MRARLKFSRAGVELIKSFEGLRQTAARLPDGRWTLGYGHTFSARDGATVTQEDADALLRFDLLPIVDSINNLVLVPLNQNQFDALVSFCFNIGVDNFAASSVLKRINEGRMTEAALAMDSWRSAEFNGQTYVLAPLIRRRAAEKSLFLTPEETNGTASSLLVRPVEDAGEGAGYPSEIDAPNHNGILSAQPTAAPETPIPAPTPPVEAPAATLPPPYASPYATPIAPLAPVAPPAFEISATPQPVPAYTPPAPAERQVIDLAAFTPRPVEAAEPAPVPEPAPQSVASADIAPAGVVESTPTAYNYDPVPVMSPDVQAALARAQEEQRFQLKYEQEQKEREEARLQAEALAAAQAAEEVRQREEMQRREEARLQDLQRQEVMRLEQERLEREAQVRAEAARQEEARQEAERYAAYRAEQERLGRERADAERVERERLEAERAERERLERVRLEQDAAEAARQEAFRQEQERLERERLEQQRLDQERAAEAARQEAVRLEQERVEREAAARAEQARVEQARLEQERLDRERREREQAAAVAQPVAADDAEKARKAEAAAALMRLYSPYGAGNLGRPLAPQRPADLTPQPQPRVQPEAQPLVQPQVSVPPQAAPHFGAPSRPETLRQETPQASAEETDPEPAEPDDLMPSVFTSASVQSPSTMPPPQITALNPYARPIPGARTVPEAIVEVPRPTSIDMSAPSNAPFVAAQATETPSTQTKPAERQPEPHWREQLNRPLPGTYTAPEPARPEAAPARAEMFGGGEGDWSLDGDRIALSAEETEEDSVSWWQMIVSTGWWILISVFGLICIGAAAAFYFRATQDPVVLRSGMQSGLTTVSIICAAAGIFFVVVSVWLIMKRLGGLKD